MNGGGALVGASSRSHPQAGSPPARQSRRRGGGPADGGDADGKDERRMPAYCRTASPRAGAPPQTGAPDGLEQQLNTLRQARLGHQAARDRPAIPAGCEGEHRPQGGLGRLRAQLKESGNGVDDGSGGASSCTSGYGRRQRRRRGGGGDTLEMSPLPNPRWRRPPGAALRALQRIASAEHCTKGHSLSVAVQGVQALAIAAVRGTARAASGAHTHTHTHIHERVEGNLT